jgi:hypothetical protein
MKSKDASEYSAAVLSRLESMLFRTHTHTWPKFSIKCATATSYGTMTILNNERRRLCEILREVQISNHLTLN